MCIGGKQGRKQGSIYQVILNADERRATQPAGSASQLAGPTGGSANVLCDLHGPYSDLQSVETHQLRKSALEAAVPSNDKCSPSRIIAMKIKINIAKTELAPERVHAATVTSIKAKGDTKCTIAFGIVADGNPFTVSKDYPAKLDRTSELLRDAETVLGRKFADTEANGEFDLETLVTKECQVVVRHRRSNGGRLVAAVETVLPASSPVLKAA